jgi:acyl-CoA synthetase (AMP-forming)/AMP-acid ligase II
MTGRAAAPTTLLELLSAIPAERTALIAPEQNVRLTYGDVRTQVQTIAEMLAAAGLHRGDRIGLALPNGIPNILTFLAASVAATAAPLNPSYKEDEFKFSLDNTNARVLLLPPDGLDEARKAAGDRVPMLTVDMDAAGIVTLRGVEGTRPVSMPGVEDVALILHTRGSTGRPKRVPLSHANLSISAGNTARSYALSSTDVSLCVMPLFHVHGLVASTLATLATGGTVVVPTTFNPLSFWRIVRDHEVTWYSAAPTIHQLLLTHVEKGAPTPAGAENLRFIRSCSASLPPRVVHDLEDAFGAPVLEAYGMTEAAHQITSNPLPPATRLPGSVGRSTDVKISIMDADGRHLAPGKRGEVVISGPNVVRGYENDPAANATSFTGGWFRTGDQGFLDENGYLTLTGRLKEMISTERRMAGAEEVGVETKMV